MNKRSLVIILALITVVLVGGWFLDRSSPAPSTPALKEFSSDRHQVSFTYPEKYLISEVDIGNGEREQSQIMLVEDTPENRRVLNGEEPGREGPIAITFDSYQNLENQDLEGWIKGNNNSNFKLALNSELKETSVGGKTALRYAWDGLYRGETLALAMDDRIITWSVTYLEPGDPIVQDFEDILKTVNWK